MRPDDFAMLSIRNCPIELIKRNEVTGGVIFGMLVEGCVARRTKHPIREHFQRQRPTQVGTHHLVVISLTEYRALAIDRGDAVRIAGESHPPLAKRPPQINRESAITLAPDETRGNAFTRLLDAELATQLKIHGFRRKRRQRRAPGADMRNKYV